MRLSFHFQWVAVLCSVFILGGCNGGGSVMSAPTQMPTRTPLQIAGNYSGTNMDSLHGQGTVNANIVQAGMSLSGGWMISYPGNPAPITSFTGTLTDNSVALTVPAGPMMACSYSVSGNISGKQISGSYTSPNCGSSGTFLMTRP